ncbi:imelysin family protein [Zavarzinia compransoris]|uniref:Imelysin-like domain-containing protein n=1 Tax=Zavarzinia compransoris TaxID=1264899 RepID=A0A317DTH6_9PROT|nr:imelysin family protein [Zavarzinia compransoris]PWR17971.1 hypothetical protein DKG75_20740 [Zavarzinia compransoris]TDP40372.1 hypothetical protein DES42_11510 [Zavarzinia compransoris]
MREWLKILTLASLLAGPPALARADDEAEGPALSAEAAAALAAMNGAIVDRHVLPAFTRLAAAAAALEAGAAAFCRAPDEAGLDRLRALYADASDGWQGVQHLRFGPLELFMRSSRLMFWPDPRDSVGRQLADLLGKGDAAQFRPDALEKLSVSIQGLPALERLLYGDDAGLLLAGNGDAALRCAAAAGIAANIARQAAGVLADWQGGSVAYAAMLKAAGGGNEYYRTPQEAAVELFKSLHLAVEMVADRKLSRALGDRPGGAKPRLLEQWRSGRSLANIRIDLAAALDLWRSGMGDVVKARDAVLAAKVDKALADLVAAAAAIEGPLDKALTDAGQRPRLVALVADAGAAKALLANEVAPALGIPVGFNALDGD